MMTFFFLYVADVTVQKIRHLPIGEVRRSKRISDKEKPNYFELARGGTLHTTEV